ncbi:hypothetical protein OLZ31_20640 [Enterobacter asburiae]|nr:hypothetical protein [Enterobacter asburiae]
MSKIVIPFNSCSLENAIKLLEKNDVNCNVDDLIYLWGEGKLALCYLFKNKTNASGDCNKVEEIEGVFYPEYKQIMNFINEEYSVIDMPLRVHDAEGKKYYIDYESLMRHSDNYGDYLNFRPKEDLSITSQGILEAYKIFTGKSAIKEHMNSEICAKNRERLYMQAIRVLIDHPDECKGKRGEITQVAWAKAIIAHYVDYGFPHISNEETIVKLLRKALHITNERK